mmetsp:Transcript_90689/g.166161  ORF Transcript_90689/g.166161 Transcript_90689/m.166161 type:complete len:114 (-) Transcript_90689:458-799(-)
MGVSSRGVQEASGGVSTALLAAFCRLSGSRGAYKARRSASAALLAALCKVDGERERVLFECMACVRGRLGELDCRLGDSLGVVRRPTKAAACVAIAFWIMSQCFDRDGLGASE